MGVNEMNLYEKEITIPPVEKQSDLLQYFSEAVLEKMPESEIPIRFVVTRTDDQGYHCELGAMSNISNHRAYRYRRRNRWTFW